MKRGRGSVRWVFPIGEREFVIYAATREQAIARAREAGLLERPTVVVIPRAAGLVDGLGRLHLPDAEQASLSFDQRKAPGS